ncbi:uncharacterized protein LOC132727913 [Ruditapes philippinarum]|uniref:uncharacterized protein LOC132727913 n=1 Tax=Ruditapes philippinarum TaxID=129788 RepID=UPI00295ABD8C|nr:uncharacterized protein LOC132727913 [Ruditapes philippinarum]
MQGNMWIVSSVVLLSLINFVTGHGRLIDPPSRSSAHKHGFPLIPVNTMDHQLNCGGFWNQWGVNQGRCGVCGDPYQGPRENEAGGKYATGTIVHTYTENAQIIVELDITVAHGGWSEFRICPNNDVHKPVTQQCLDKFILASPSGDTRYIHQRKRGTLRIPLVLPPGLTCTQCVLQWKWNAASNFNCDPITHKCCKGCGLQEQFYGCADISIIKPYRPPTIKPYNGQWAFNHITTVKSDSAKIASKPTTVKQNFIPPFNRQTQPYGFIPIFNRRG